VGFFCHSFEIFLWKTGWWDRSAYCAMIMAEVLDIAYVNFGAKGSVSGKLYCTVTVTKFPGLLHGFGEPGHVEPDV